jgi:hypothetical protein
MDAKSEPIVQTRSLDTLPTVSVKHWIRICFDADPDPAFYLNADPDLGSQTNADPSGSRSWSDLADAKIAFIHEKYTSFL